ncbi:MAG: histidine kinase, partial [Bacteroidota bacterium]|nr:histidine kinase [Bacteroidota bacterium]
LDSHFTFNVLNSLSASILRNERKEAYKQLIIFSKVLRHSFDKSESIVYSLENEIEFIQNYLVLEKYRYKNKFEYNIQIDDDVNLMHNIPKRMIQIFISNSIRHGIMPLTTGGKIDLKIENDKNNLVITIEDNGIGRESAESSNKLHPPGDTLKFIKELFTIFNKKNRHKLEYHYFDLYKNGKESGTKVKIHIPNNFNFDIL